MSKRIGVPADSFADMKIKPNKELDNNDLRKSLLETLKKDDSSEIKQIKIVDVESRNKAQEFIK